MDCKGREEGIRGWGTESICTHLRKWAYTNERVTSRKVDAGFRENSRQRGDYGQGNCGFGPVGTLKGVIFVLAVAKAKFDQRFRGFHTLLAATSVRWRTIYLAAHSENVGIGPGKSELVEYEYVSPFRRGP